MGTAVSTMALSSSLSLLKSVSLRTRPAISYLNFRQFHPSLAANMPINVGDKVPSVELFEDSPANKVNAAELTAGKKTVIFGVPGAFTPGCSKVFIELSLQFQDVEKTSLISCRHICQDMWPISRN